MKITVTRAQTEVLGKERQVGDVLDVPQHTAMKLFSLRRAEPYRWRPGAPLVEEAEQDQTPDVGADDLTVIDGIGPATVRKLAERGVTTYNQLAGSMGTAALASIGVPTDKGLAIVEQAVELAAE